jgi:hypothetical protein
MAMKKMGDIQPKRHSIGRTPGTVSETPIHVHKQYIPGVEPERRSPVSFERREQKSIKPYLWVFFSLCIGLGIFFVIEKLGTVTISFLPLEKTVTIDTTAALSREGGNKTLPYEIMSVEDSLEYTLLDKIESEVAPTLSKIQASVRVFNAYSTTPVKLAKGTTFVSSQTKTTFALDADLTIPGYKKSGSTRLPGSIDATITTPETIAQIPVTPQDFTLPSYAKLPETSQVYARSLSSLTPVITNDPALALRVDTEQETKLKTELLEHIKKELPSGYTFFENITSFENVKTEQVSFDPVKPQDHKQKISGKISTLIFKQSDLDTYLIENSNMDESFKKADAHAVLAVVKENITATADIKSIITESKGDLGISGDFLVKKSFESKFLCDALGTLPLKELTNLRTSNKLLEPYVGQIEVHVFPPWLFTKPSPKRFHCGFIK